MKTTRRGFFSMLAGAVGLAKAKPDFAQLRARAVPMLTPMVRGAELIRIQRVYNAGMHSRLDVLYGWVTLRPQMACRIVGGEDGEEIAA